MREHHHEFVATEAGEEIESARLADGRLLFNDPKFVTFLVNLIKGNPMKQNDSSSQRPSNTAALKEMEEIRSKMGSREYTQSETMQQRYRELIRLTGRS